MTDFLVAALQITSSSNIDSNFAEAEEQIELASRRGQDSFGSEGSLGGGSFRSHARGALHAI